jgi:hypothetical protein
MVIVNPPNHERQWQKEVPVAGVVTGGGGLTWSLIVSGANMTPVAFVEPYDLVLGIVPAFDPWKERNGDVQIG